MLPAVGRRADVTPRIPLSRAGRTAAGNKERRGLGRGRASNASRVPRTGRHLELVDVGEEEEDEAEGGDPLACGAG